MPGSKISANGVGLMESPLQCSFSLANDMTAQVSWLRRRTVVTLVQDCQPSFIVSKNARKLEALVERQFPA